MQGFPLIINFIVMPLFFLSGALFPISGLPTVFGQIVRFNPLSYAVDGIRGALTGSHVFSFTLDGIVLVIITLLCLFIGSALFKRIQA
jgi:ABC-2 type transport system permease protein